MGWLLSLTLITGCLHHACAPMSAQVATQLADRVGVSTSSAAAPCSFVVPTDVVLEDGVSEDEAIALALANNSAFQATRAQLLIAHGDVIQAHLLTNPNIATMLPVGVKQWEWTLYAPIEACFLRPQRVAIAQADYQRWAQQVVQSGLTLVRDVRWAYVDAVVAFEQARLANEAAQLRADIDQVTRKRLADGDISELESLAAQVEALSAAANVGMTEQALVMANSRLLLLMGAPPDWERFDVAPLTTDSPPTDDVAIWIAEAMACRPDLRAAEWTVRSAARRARLARKQFWRVDGGLDANARGERGYEVGPALRFDVPIFNRNQGGIARADAELLQARHQCDAIRDQILQEVRSASAQVAQARRMSEILEQQVIPKLDEAVSIARKGYEDGGTDYLLVLQTTTQYLDARGRWLVQSAALRRAVAELERAVGHRLMPSYAVLPPEPVPASEVQP